MKIQDKFLTIGTVVQLKKGVKPIMIVGFCSSPKDINETHDYVGCLYPEGIIDSDNLLVFNHEQIEIVLFEGFKSPLEIDFKKRLNNLVEQGSNVGK